MMKDSHGQKIPLYRTRIIFLIVISLLLIFWSLPRSNWPFQGSDIILVVEVLSLMTPVIFVMLLVDVIVNGKYLFSDQILERRNLSYVILSVEILFLLASGSYTILLIYLIVALA
jgi:hypothetical protein